MPIIAVDIGGTHIKLGIVRRGAVVAHDSIPAEAHCGLAPALDRLEAGFHRLCQQAGLEISEIRGIGLAFPGVIHPHSGKILSSPAGKFDDAKALDLHGWALTRFGLPLAIANDANAALAAEWRFGAAHGYRSVVMVTLGTGIGTSVIIDGVALRGEHGQAGNMGGHFVQNFSGRPCPCGNVGCAETEASNWAVAILARTDAALPGSALANEPQIDLAAVFRLAAQGDPLAVKIRDHCLNIWSGLTVSLIHAYDPEIVVLGGGVMQSAETIVPAIQTHVERHAWTPWGKVRVVPAALGNEAGMLGVGYLAEQLATERNGSPLAGTPEVPGRPHIKLPQRSPN